ncbi:hypothetical protein CLV35_1281 [Motilibacter peucedani]|uniref:Uncharacterized protein n=1 Tax=Motilibacter peucedani TaxID=598650 RepID=A0A420XS16_9ACTN|nr:hypothetical protein [Motilibacter peucedani]RKS77587.1 hypothetical protein CLV35_1281 [Motilibacter peucedani]
MTTPLSSRCPARSKRSGEQCKRFVVGGGVCPMHGGSAPQVRAKREVRIALQEQLASSERRSSADILVDAQHAADVVARDLQTSIERGTATPGDVEQLMAAWQRAASLAKVTADARVDERRVGIAEQQGDLMAAGVQWLLDELGRNDAAGRALAGRMFSALGQGVLPSRVVPGEVSA